MGRQIRNLIIILLSSNIYGQGRLMINSNAFIVLSNNAKLVIENPNDNALETIGGGGNIITESEFNQVVWYIGSSMGTYRLPFTTNGTLTKIQFVADITTSGSSNGKISFSTFPGSTWDNDTYRPSDVTHMYDFTSGSVNNSNHVIDRFWIIDPAGYTTLPQGLFSFRYRDSEHLQVGNTIVEANLGAQRFNNTSNAWGDYMPSGFTNATFNTTSGVPVTAGNFFRSWTLSEINFPLAVELAYFRSSCDNQFLNFEWMTVAESNVSHFEIIKIEDNGTNLIKTIAAQGNSSQNNLYSFSIESRFSGVYKLVEVDLNGIRSDKGMLNVTCENTDEVLTYYNNNQIYLKFKSDTNEIEEVQLIDMTGKIVHTSLLPIEKGQNDLIIPNINLSSGLYSVIFKVNNNFIRNKIRIIK